MIRDCTLADVPWLAETAEGAYRGLVEGFDRAAAEGWIGQCLADPSMWVVRGETHAGFATFYRFPWAPTESCCDLVHLYGPKRQGLEPLRIVEAFDQKRRALGCRRFYIGSIYADLSPIAKRLGGQPTTTMWVIE